MNPAEKKLMEAWELNQKAEHEILQALTDLKNPEAQYCPKDSITTATNLQTQSSIILDKAKTLIS